MHLSHFISKLAGAHNCDDFHVAIQFNPVWNRDLPPDFVLGADSEATRTLHDCCPTHARTRCMFSSLTANQGKGTRGCCDWTVRALQGVLCRLHHYRKLFEVTSFCPTDWYNRDVCERVEAAGRLWASCLRLFLMVQRRCVGDGDWMDVGVGCWRWKCLWWARALSPMLFTTGEGQRERSLLDEREGYVIRRGRLSTRWGGAGLEARRQVFMRREVAPMAVASAYDTFQRR